MDDSYSTTHSESQESTTLDDSQSTTAMLAAAESSSSSIIAKKKKKSLASRVKGKLGKSSSSTKDKDKNDKDKKDKSKKAQDGKKDEDGGQPEDVTVGEEEDANNMPHDATVTAASTTSMEVPPTPRSSSGGLGSLAKRMGRRLSLGKVKDKPLEHPLALMTAYYDDDNDDDDHDGKEAADPAEITTTETTSDTTHKQHDKENSTTKKGKTLLGLRFGGGGGGGGRGKKSKIPPGMALLEDSFASLGTVDRAILETTATMQQALQEFDRGDDAAADHDDYLLANLELEDMDDEELALNDNDENMDDDRAIQQNLMKSFAQLDFASMGLGLGSDDDDDDETTATEQQAAALGEDTPGTPKRELVVRRNHGNHRKSSLDTKDDDDHNAGDGATTSTKLTKRSPGRKKKSTPSRSHTTGETTDGPFDWEKHAGGGHRRSKSLTSLRANALRQKQRKAGLPKNAPRGGGN